MTARFHNICVDCHDPYTLAGFWAQVFGCLRPTQERPGDPEASLRPEGGPYLLFLAVPEGKRDEPRTVTKHPDLPKR